MTTNPEYQLELTMTHADVQAAVAEFAPKYPIAFIPVHGQMMAAAAEAKGGFAEVNVKYPVPWNKDKMGRLMPLYVLVFDALLPLHEQLAVVLHEVGHVDYCQITAKCEQTDADSEFHAQRFALEELLKRGFHESLRFVVEQVELSQLQGANLAQHYIEAHRRLIALDSWRAAKDAI